MTPDLLLIVHEQRSSDGSTRLSFLAKTRESRGGLSFDRFDSSPFRTDPMVHFKELFRDIERMAQAGGPLDGRLESLGVLLCEQLVPVELRRKLWSIHRSLKTIQVHSDETWVPWELLKLRDPDDDAAFGPFLAEGFALSRWLTGCREVTRLPLRRIAFVAPAESRLRFADAEHGLLETLKGRSRRVRKIPAFSRNVVKALGSGKYDAWHFAGHGFATEDNPDLWKLELDSGQTLMAADLYGPARRLGGASPLVFLNACHSGRGGVSLTGLGGLAHAFLKAGAAAFIGSHWSLNDTLAHRFAEAFYAQLLAGEPIGEAVRRARAQLREAFPESPDWLAYTLFAHPLATCDDRRKARPEPSKGTPPKPPPPRTTKKPARKKPPRRAQRPAAPPPELEAAAGERVHEIDGTVLVYVPGGRFHVGADDVHDWSRPPHEIRLSPFWIGKFPVTNAQYARFLEDNDGYPEPAYWNDEKLDRPRCPVVGVSFADAEAYCRWAGLELPSEAQWEAAARGHDQRAYPWGDDPPSPAHANCAGKIGTPTDVGAHPDGVGPFGTYEQAGNVWEWCRDHWESTAYKDRDGDERDPVTYANPDVRVVRGGSWNSPAKDLRAAYRDRRAATKRLHIQGFRCVLPGQ